MNIWEKNRFLGYNQDFLDWNESTNNKQFHKINGKKTRTKILLMLAFFSYWGSNGYASRKDCDFRENKVNVDANDKNIWEEDDKAYNFEIVEDEYKSSEVNNTQWENFWWISLSHDRKYIVPWVNQESIMNNKYKREFPNVQFSDCRLDIKPKKWERIWTVVYWNALVKPANWKHIKETHKETYYSMRVLPWEDLDIPWRHVAEDGTIRDKDWYICVAANYIPKWSLVMTTLWPGKVYDTWGMRGKWVDIYTFWDDKRHRNKERDWAKCKRELEKILKRRK